MKRSWLNVKQASEHFSISPKTLYSLIARGRLPSGAVLKLGRQIRINIERIETEGIQK